MHTLAVKLAAGIVYVVGTVNGEAVDWHLVQGSMWRAVVVRSDDGVYDIEATGYDELGRSTTYRTTLRYGLSAVTNRGPGTYYNTDDLNRVGRAVQYLTDLLAGYGYYAQTEPRTDWTQEDFPDAGGMEVYLGSIRALMDVYAVLPTTPPLPESMKRLGYEGANAIEQTLLDMYYLIQNMAAAFRYSGEIYAGEDDWF